MSLLPFLLVTGLGTIADAGAARPRSRSPTGVGMVALLAAVIAALLIQPGQSVAFGDGGIATTDYLRLFLVLGALVCLLLAIVGAATGVERDGTAVALGILGDVGARAVDPRRAGRGARRDRRRGVRRAAGARAGRRPGRARRSGTRVLRAAAVAGTMAIAATAWIGRDLSELAAQPVVFGLAYLAFALAVAIRFGAIPFHAWAARLTDAVPETALPLVTASAPAALAIVALAWADASIAPLALDLGSVQLVVLVVAIASIVLASLAAWIQDDLEHVVGYSIVGDAGVVMLAIAALDPAAWAPARTWILAFVVTRSAFAAWAAATRATFGTGRVADLRGWALRSPLLAAVLAVVVLASIGLPALAAARRAARSSTSCSTARSPSSCCSGRSARSSTTGGCFAIGAAGRGAAAGAVAAGRLGHRPDRTCERGWSRTWTDNRLLAATGGAALLARARARRVGRRVRRPEAAAGLPPTHRDERRVVRTRRVAAAGGVGVTGAVGRARAVGRAIRVELAVRRVLPRPVADGLVRAGPDALARIGSRRSLLRGEHPAVDVALVVEQLVVANHSASSATAASGPSDAWTMFWAVSSAKSPRIGAGRRLVRARRAVDRADDGDRVRALEGERDERRRRDEVDEAAEERLLAMGRVVPLGEVAVDLDQLEADDLEAALLVAREDPTGQLALDAVGLDEDEGAFGHGRSPSGGGWSGRAASA